MSSKSILKRLSLSAVLVFAFVSLSVTNVSAHVTVKPGETTTATYQLFTVSVPNEKEQPTTSVKVVIPAGVTNVTPTQKTGWSIQVEKEGDTLTSITWSSGAVGVGMRDDFTFTAKTPAQAGSLQWKAYQTYADGTVVSWDQQEAGDGHGDENKGPVSVTAIVATSTEDSITNEKITHAESRADRALYIAVAAVGIALISVFFATRKK